MLIIDETWLISASTGLASTTEVTLGALSKFLDGLIPRSMVISIAKVLYLDFE